MFDKEENAAYNDAKQARKDVMELVKHTDSFVRQSTFEVEAELAIVEEDYDIASAKKKPH